MLAILHPPHQDKAISRSRRGAGRIVRLIPIQTRVMPKDYFKDKSLNVEAFRLV